MRSLKSSDNLLSKSVDNGLLKIEELCETGPVTFAGFLLKRSNHPINDETDSLSIPNPPLHEDDYYYSKKPQTPKASIAAADAATTTPDTTDQFAQAMFGVDMTSLKQTKLKAEGPPPPKVSISPSKPIPMKQSPSDYAFDTFQHSNHNRTTNQNATGPPDIRDADGHVWRTKYCILEQGILYFYRNQKEAESEEAAAERRGDLPTDSQKQRATTNIAHSPMPSKLLTTMLSGTTEHVWEKRVYLDLVGAVRSAEVEFGPHVFELLAVVDEEVRLVLKVPPPDEMKEWLFQFHRSIATHVEKLVVSADPGILAHRHDGAYFSPRFFGTSVLSHGHGRASLRRRPSPASPESPNLPFPMNDDELLPFVTPLKATPVAPFIPPATSTRNASKYVPPGQRPEGYISPFARRKNASSLSLAERLEQQKEEEREQEAEAVIESQPSTPEIESESESEEEVMEGTQTFRGGCADPLSVSGSIVDSIFIPNQASKVKTGGSFGSRNSAGSLRWEIGAISERGLREYNEDAYMISSDLPEAWCSDSSVIVGIFDGHAGCQASRFTAEKLVDHLRDQTGSVEDCLGRAIKELDTEFCQLCSRDGRDWGSGTTALVSVVVEDALVVANLGDSRGVMGCLLNETSDTIERAGWNALLPGDYSGSGQCLWKSLSTDHVPARRDEKVRVEAANGWVTEETEIPIGQLRRIRIDDQDVVDVLRRCLVDGHHLMQAGAPHQQIDISRVCGDLQVTRAIGDRDFKAEFNAPDSDDVWECPWALCYPADHSRQFVGDLVSNVPECETVRLGSDDVCDEFMVLGCDGLWDVMGCEDAIRIGRDLLFEKRLTAKKTAARLAELAIHLGSSDNITVIVVRFFKE